MWRILTLILTLPAVLTLAGNLSKAESAFRAGNRSFERGYFAGAVEMYTRAVERDPQDIKAYYNRALANEMVDRKAAMRDWRQFLELAGTDPACKAATSQVRERLQILEKKPALPDALQPSGYLPKAGDYYQQVAQSSEGLQFSQFPVKVFVGSVPKDWGRAVREALKGWLAVFPLEGVTSREGADIVLSWERSTKESRRPGWENDLVQVQKGDDGTIVRRTRVAFVTLNSSCHWSEEQKGATVSHEIGHALGIQGHSDNPRDVMFAFNPGDLNQIGEPGVRAGSALFRNVADESVTAPAPKAQPKGCQHAYPAL
jgi:predicted Zn-dependent protease